MSLKDAGVRAVLLAAVGAAMLAGCGIAYRGARDGVLAVADSEIFWRGRHGRLSEQEREWALAAWAYFDRNYRPETGLVDSVERYPSASMWNAADALAAAMAAQALGLIDERTFDERASRLLDFLNTMPLVEGRVPNRVYDTQTGAMVDYENRPGQIGWSAVDIGRLLVWLEILKARHPALAEYADKAVLRWSFCDVIDGCGRLWGGVVRDERVDVFDEGRRGYQQYAARGYEAWGFEVGESARWQPYQEARIFDVLVPYDARDPRETGVQAPVVSLPHLLTGLEFNWDRTGDARSRDSRSTDPEALRQAEIVYTVQERRWQREQVLTARTDHLIGRPPYFVWDAIWVDGTPWHTVSDAGQPVPDAALVSTRAAFGMWALWRTPYTEELIAAVDQLYDPERGWFEGRSELTGGHEATLSCSTNAVVLEALWYKAAGKLYRAPADPGHVDARLRDEFRRPQHCFPVQRERCE